MAPSNAKKLRLGPNGQCGDTSKFACTRWLAVYRRLCERRLGVSTPSIKSARGHFALLSLYWALIYSPLARLGSARLNKAGCKILPKVYKIKYQNGNESWARSESKSAHCWIQCKKIFELVCMFVCMSTPYKEFASKSNNWIQLSNQKAHSNHSK